MFRDFKGWLVEILAATIIVAAFGVSLIAFAQIESPVVSAPRFPIPVRVIDIKDGDTIAADILLPWDVTLRGQDLRESSYDAWESSKRRRSEAAGEITDAEVGKGKLATESLAKLLAGGNVYVEPSPPSTWASDGKSIWVETFGERDVYGRVLAKLWVKRESGWLDVGAEMKRRGHLRK